MYCELSKNFMDLKKCKLTHAGVNFLGELSETWTGFRCRRWEMTVIFDDDDFPDLSTKRANNFCRNPNADPDGPWCYIDGGKQKKDTCNVPLCSSYCRLTGPGMEYSGTVSFSTSNRCELWSKNWENLVVKQLDGSTLTDKKYSNVKFHNKSAAASLYNYCRNPDGDVGGKNNNQFTRL